ncbi:dockerin type I domain-containing protein [Paenibacillus sp. GCM10027629]|uniref:endo-beta-N-acetylglucosaminidase n=1 Tax=Paenibacillus sp. GCM10027629 TaxID=3273414 RepID=UPI0036270B59
MNGKLKKRFVVFLASVLTIGTMLNATIVQAGGDTLPPRPGEQGFKGKNQPVYHGHRKQNIVDWTPENDEYYDFMRAKVPLQNRNEPFKPTQANPMLDQEVQSLLLTGDYGNEFFNPTIYNDQFALYLFNFWQYVDYTASWHGVVTNPTPDSLFNPEADWWQREYEFGVLNIPNPAYTNAAHKNGVKSIGCIFFPRNEHTDDFIYKDKNGRFPVADKLVEIAKYYGFDGYFVNAEEALPASFMPVYEDFIRSMTSQGIYIQVYASNRYGQNNQSSWGSIDYYNKDASVFSNWIKDPTDQTVAAHSLYMNPDPSKANVDGSVASMKALGLDPRNTVFNTLEAGQTGFSGTRGALYNTYDENLVPRTGIASLGASTVFDHLDEQLFGHSGPNKYTENRRGNPEYYKYIAQRERTWFSGAANAPTYNGGKGTLASAGMTQNQLAQAVLTATPDPVKTANDPNRGKPNQGQQYKTWPGLAAYISERSVIDGSNFYTYFNTGHGMEYYIDGKVSNPNEWANINIQDILPTWQWWIDTDGTRLKVDFDYGKKYSSGYNYTQLGGYQGGSSLVIYGDLDATNFVRLYKTKLDIKDSSKLNITYNKPSATDASSVKVGLIFEDDPSKVEYIDIPSGANKTTKGWDQKNLDLSPFAGRTLASFGLAFTPEQGTIENYQFNVGEIKITDGTVAKSAAPTGLKIDKSFDTSEMYISWNLDDYSKVERYNVYAEYENGTEIFLGGTYDDRFYIKSLYNPQGLIKIKVTAVGVDGRESKAAVVENDFSKTVKNINTTENVGSIDVTWETPAIQYAKVKVDVTFNYSNKEGYSTTLEQGTNEAKIQIPVTDGSAYTVRISLLNADGLVISYADHTGVLKDDHADVYEGVAILKGTRVKLSAPTSYDWWHLYAWQNGKQITFKDGRAYAIRGVDDLTSIPVSGTSGFIEVVLEDFNGNKSKPVQVPYGVIKLVKMTAPANITGVTNGTAKTAVALGLPSTVELVTDAGPMNALVAWKVETSNYNPGQKAEQTFTVDGTVTLPEGVGNPNNVVLTTSISVTVNAATAADSMQAVLLSNDTVRAGASFDLTYGLQQVKGAIYAQDLTITYDPTKVEFVSADSMKEGFTIVDQDRKSGQVHLVAVSLGEGKGVTSDDKLLKLNWQAKSLSQNDSATITFSKMTVADNEGAETQLADASHRIQIIAAVMKDELKALVDEAQRTHDGAVEGTKPGQYPIGTRAVLQAAIDKAKAVVDNENATQQQIDQALIDLSTSLQTFKDSVVKRMLEDINGDGKISIGDLAIVAQYYGRTSADPNWNQVKHADINGDGKIDITDLSMVARRILESI